MMRSLLASVAALALTTGIALAQDHSYSQTTTRHSVDAWGNEIERTETYSQSMAPGSRSTTVTTEARTAGSYPPAPPMVVRTDSYPPGPPVVIEEGDEIAAAPDDMDAPSYPPPPPPGPPSSYSETTTTRTLDNGGVQVDKSRKVEKNQAFINEDGEMSARSKTTTQTHSTTVVPPTAVVPPPLEHSRTTTTTTTHYGD